MDTIGASHVPNLIFLFLFPEFWKEMGTVLPRALDIPRKCGKARADKVRSLLREVSAFRKTNKKGAIKHI
jgi:hypothetical protein